MATKAQTIDINKIIADAKAQAAASKAAQDKAKKEAATAKAKNSYEQAVKFVVAQKNQRLAGLDTNITQYLFDIQRIAKDIAAGTVTPGDKRYLPTLVKQYNDAVKLQNQLIDEVTGLVDKTADLDLATGKVTLGTSAKTVQAPEAKDTGAASAGKTGPKVGTEATPAAAAAFEAAYPTASTKGSTTGGSDAKGTTTTGVTPSGVSGQSNQGQTKKYTGAGTVQSPLTLNGKTFTGTYNGKTYKNGVAAAVDSTGLTAEQQAVLGQYGSKYLIDYFKSNYPTIYNKLIEFAKTNADPTTVVEPWLRNTSWYTDVNKRTESLIGAASLANGITLTATQAKDYRDQYLAKVKSIDEIGYEIRLKAIDTYQLDTTKPDVARSIRAGSTFADAVADYAEIYRKNLGIAQSAFTVADPNFLNLFKRSTNLTDFDKAIKRTDQYLSQPAVQQQINANKLMVQQKYRQYGLSITAEAAANLGKNVLLGDTTNEQLDENLRQQALKAFPAFRDRILNGESPLSIASPYIGAMTRILEIPEGGLDLEDPTIRMAMQGKAITKGDSTTYETIPLWQFEQNLYKDSRWQYTANARAKADSVVLDVGRMMGLIG